MVALGTYKPSFPSSLPPLQTSLLQRSCFLITPHTLSKPTRCLTPLLSCLHGLCHILSMRLPHGCLVRSAPPRVFRPTPSLHLITTLVSRLLHGKSALPRVSRLSLHLQLITLSLLIAVLPLLICCRVRSALRRVFSPATHLKHTRDALPRVPLLSFHHLHLARTSLLEILLSFISRHVRTAVPRVSRLAPHSLLITLLLHQTQLEHLHIHYPRSAQPVTCPAITTHLHICLPHAVTPHSLQATRLLRRIQQRPLYIHYARNVPPRLPLAQVRLLSLLRVNGSRPVWLGMPSAKRHRILGQYRG
jgi:hypothetical protein